MKLKEGAWSSFYNGVKYFDLSSEERLGFDPGSIAGSDENAVIWLFFGDNTSVDWADDKRVEHTWRAGDIFYAPPGAGGDVECPSMTPNLMKLTIPQPQLDILNPQLARHGQTLRGQKRDEVANHLLMAMMRTDAKEDPLLVDHLTSAIVSRVNRWCLPGTAETLTRNTGKIGRAVEYIHANLISPMTVAELASVACLSDFHFARQFKAQTGRSPHVYVKEKRIEMAKAMIARGDVNLSSVAIDCGFSHQSHFSNAFKQVTGETPGGFAKRRPGREGSSKGGF